MTTDLRDLEHRLRSELEQRARTTRTSPSARDEILARTARSRPRPSWRRPAVALVAAVTLLVAAVWVVSRGEGDPAPPVPPAQPLPDRPPAVEGTIVGVARSTSCSGDCVRAPATLDLTDLAGAHLLTDSPTGQSSDHVLRDGRRVVSEGPGAGWAVVDPDTGRRIPLGQVRPESVDVLPDGRIVTLEAADHDDDPADLRIVGDGGTTPTRLPDGFQPYAITTGPGGWVAVVGDDDGCCLDEPELVLVAPGGGMRRVDIGDAVDDVAWPVSSSLSLSWSSRGLIVLSPAALEFTGDRRPETPRNWAVVVDPATGEEVARLPDWWQGLAWSPDGSGLLAAQPVDDGSARLRVYWGPRLRHSRDLGVVDLPFATHWWLPPEGAAP